MKIPEISQILDRDGDGFDPWAEILSRIRDEDEEEARLTVYCLWQVGYEDAKD